MVQRVRLADGRDVVVKMREPQERLVACTAAQRHLWLAGFPCPEPLAGPHPLGPYAANAEAAVEPDGVQPVLDAGAFAGLLAELIRLGPEAQAVPTLEPPPPWAWWRHDAGAVWPPPDNRDAGLNAHPETAWLDDLGTRIRRRLHDAVRGLEPAKKASLDGLDRLDRAEAAERSRRAGLR
ncbi:hypothetical protein GCM10010399_60830 [Dactylosporangium fulvum]